MTETLDLDPLRWRRAQELFHTALEHPVEERSAWLDRTCGEDRRLYAAVVALLDAADGATDRVDRVVDSAATTLAGGHPDRIDAYRILDLLGRGGMGAVYLAERDDEHYRQQVAIKVVRHGLGHPELLARLRQERQILANLRHPHIARLLDGGNTVDGSPYVVMEHIDGEPIDTWCDHHRLDVDRRLELFAKVCDAVQHAHRNLVIHRDLKPSNLLVDRDGEPKLLDFGIAKLLDPALVGPSSAETAPGVLHLTPEYASPEQFGDLPLTTATDTYSLGVVLYELLTGRRPHVVRRARLPFAVCGIEPPLASDAMGQSADPDRVAVDRATTVDSLRRRLTGDLDTILDKALRKEPERRYASVEQLADDVRRHLTGLPVLARPATFRYRVGKFVARHRAATLATLVGSILVSMLTAFYTTRLSDERARVLAEASRRATVGDFLIRLFGAAHPDEARGDELTLREFLDQSASHLEAELDEPELRSEIHDA
ncbi:MAG: serine/threonine-protein kinase, partial [Acidobacteriota bacterium]